MDRPNVIYILGDDHRADYLSGAGHAVLRTPNLDQLAQEGTYFPNAFCTSPACTPSRACHYTGLWERRHGVNFNSGSALSEAAWDDSFPRRLQAAGYVVGWVGKNHVPAGGTGPDAAGYDSGYFERIFDYWYGNHGHSGFYPKEMARDGHIYRNAAADTQVEIFEEGALNFLEPNPRFEAAAGTPLPRRPEDRPFCLCVTFNLPHGAGTYSMQLRPSDDDLYRSAYRDVQQDLQPPPTYVPWMEAWETPRIPRDVWNGVFIPQYDYIKSPVTLRERQVRTCQTVSGMDRMLGRLRAKLADLGLADNTIIVFSTDHGLHHGEHGLGGKCFLYEEDIRIPMIVYDPRRAGGRVRDEFVVAPDLAPTVLDLCGIETPPIMQGRSLRPLLDGEQVDWRQEVFTEQLMDIQNYPRSESLRTADWKYIRYFRRTEDPAQARKPYRGTLDNYIECLDSTLDDERPVFEELFDLREDPGETRNLAFDPLYADRLADLQARLIQTARPLRDDRTPPRTVPTV